MPSISEEYRKEMWDWSEPVAFSDVDDKVTVGDLESEERGSGARKSEGKLPMQLIPVWIWAAAIESQPLPSTAEDRAFEALAVLSNLQVAGDLDVIAAGIQQHLESYSVQELEDACRVFEYGTRKYKAWNWAKGMPWSVPVGCIMRHVRKILEEGELEDDESHYSHVGHIVCNFIMLEHFSRNCRDMEDGIFTGPVSPSWHQEKK